MLIKDVTYRLTHWETWDWRIKYFPLVPIWLWYCLKARSFWFFTPSNPTLLFGGFEGETKKKIYEHLPADSFPASIYINLELPFNELLKLVSENFSYPFIVKPDVGRMGFMFRKIANQEQLKHYHEKISVDYIVQEFINYPLEVSVFYFKFPGDTTGTITGFIKKEFLSVCGDGQSTLLELMSASARVRLRLDEMKIKHKDRLDFVVPKAECFNLSYALNLSRGGKLVSLEYEKDENLLNVFDGLSNYSKTLFYGRYDIKCASVDDLKMGKNFSIIEYNGCGAEPHHVYGNGYSLFEACKILAYHWKVLYQISKKNNQLGIPYYNFRRGWKLMKTCRKYFAGLSKIDAHFPVN